MATVRADARRVSLVLAAVALAGPTSALLAQDGSGDSYWGPIPPPADSVRAATRNRPRPAWETAVLVPYWIVGFPLRLVTSGLGETVEFLDEHHVVTTIGHLFGPREGPFGVTVELRAGGVSGLGGGVGIAHDALFGRRGNALRLSAATTTRGDTRLKSGFRFPFGANQVETGLGYRVRERARYFGIGPETQPADRAYYRQEILWGGIGYRRALGAGLHIAADAVASSVDTRDTGDDDLPTVSTRFAGRLPTGYGATSAGISLRVTLAHEDAPETGRPERGGVHRVRAELFRDTDDGTTIATYRAELQQYVRLWYPYHVLALRGLIAWTDDVSADPIPFTRLYTNDDPDLLRGFDDFRWRDRGIVIVSAEYRWPLWSYARAEAPGVDAYFLADVGQVFESLDAIQRDRLTVSGGFGLRVLSAGGFIMRIEYARSAEGGVWRLRGDQIFQFAHGTLFDGRDPVPAR